MITNDYIARGLSEQRSAVLLEEAAGYHLVKSIRAQRSSRHSRGRSGPVGPVRFPRQRKRPTAEQLTDQSEPPAPRPVDLADRCAA